MGIHQEVSENGFSLNEKDYECHDRYVYVVGKTPKVANYLS